MASAGIEIFPNVSETDEYGQRVTRAERTGRPEDGVFYQHELMEAAIQRHNYNDTKPGRRDLRGRSFFVHVSQDGMSVRVVEE